MNRRINFSLVSNRSRLLKMPAYAVGEHGPTSVASAIGRANGGVGEAIPCGVLNGRQLYKTTITRNGGWIVGECEFTLRG